MNLTDRSPAQSPAQREGIIAELACLACVAYLFGIVGPVVQSLPHWWEELLVYLLPLTLTFTLLCGSHIHREMNTAKRTAFLLGTAAVMFAGAVLIVLGIVGCGGLFSGLARGHF
jgi:hypothetical protein